MCCNRNPSACPIRSTEFENVVFTCHYASLSEESYAIMRQQTSEQALQIIRGEFPMNFVNPQVKDTPQCRLRKYSA